MLHYYLLYVSQRCRETKDYLSIFTMYPIVLFLRQNMMT